MRLNNDASHVGDAICHGIFEVEVVLNTEFSSQRVEILGNLSLHLLVSGLGELKQVDQSSHREAASQSILTGVVLPNLVRTIGCPVEVSGEESSGNLIQHVISELLGDVLSIGCVVGLLQISDSLLELVLSSFFIVSNLLSGIDSLLQSSSIGLVQCGQQLISLCDQIFQDGEIALEVQTEVVPNTPGIGTCSAHTNCQRTVVDIDGERSNLILTSREGIGKLSHAGTTVSSFHLVEDRCDVVGINNRIVCTIILVSIVSQSSLSLHLITAIGYVKSLAQREG